MQKNTNQRPSSKFSSWQLLIVICLVTSCYSTELSDFHKTVLSPPPVTPKHIILFIGDGMQLEHEVAASRYLYGVDFGLTWHGFPYRSYASTWDVDVYNAYASDDGKPDYSENNFDPILGYDPSQGGIAPYPIVKTGSVSYLLRAATDSAGAATALATGVKTDSGNISWRSGDPPNGAIVTIAQQMKKHKGAAIGVVTTVPFNDATPAAFVSHNTNRGDLIGIADEIIHVTAPDVVIGAGHPDWGATITAEQLDYLRNSGDYVLVERVAGENGGARLIAAAENLPPSGKLFGLFGGSGGLFEPPVPQDNPGNPNFVVEDENPSLAEATEAALTVLSRNKHGFFIMAEGGAIDKANHANNYSMMIGCMWDFEKAVRAAVDFVNRPGDDIDWTNTLLIVTADHANSLMRLTDNPELGAGDLPTQVGGSYPDGEVTYGTSGHTNELVTVYAMGADSYLFYSFEGSWYPGDEIIDDTQIFMTMAKAGGVLY